MSPTTTKSAAKKKVATKDPAKKVLAKAGMRRSARKPISNKKGSKGLATRAQALVPTEVKQTAMKMLAGAAAGAVRAIIPPLQRAVASNETGASPSKAKGGKRVARDE